jgi:hypothetical protein
MVAGLQLQHHAPIRGYGAGVGRTLILHSDGCLAGFVHPRRGAEGAKLDGFGSRNEKEIEQVITAGKAGRVVKGWCSRLGEAKQGTGTQECRQDVPNHIYPVRTSADFDAAVARTSWIGKASVGDQHSRP